MDRFLCNGFEKPREIVLRGSDTGIEPCPHSRALLRKSSELQCGLHHRCIEDEGWLAFDLSSHVGIPDVHE